MRVFDIVRIVGPKTITSYLTNSRILIEHNNEKSVSVANCQRYNECRNSTDYHYKVEEHEEESLERASLTLYPRRETMNDLVRKESRELRNLVMSRKHYQAIADVIKNSNMFRSEVGRRKFAEDMANTIARFNGHLDHASFLTACCK